MGSSLPNGASDVREVYQLVQAMRTELLNEIKSLESAWDAKLTMHEAEHRRDRDNRSSLTRWAVTTMLSGLLGFSGWAAFMLSIIE